MCCFFRVKDGNAKLHPEWERINEVCSYLFTAWLAYLLLYYFNYSKTLKMTNFGTGHLQKIVIFKLLLKPSFARSFGHLGLFARSNSLNANRHLARFVTFEVVICEVLLYCPFILSFMYSSQQYIYAIYFSPMTPNCQFKYPNLIVA